MIKPASYWAMHKHADPTTLGRVGVALAGREAELNPPLSPAEEALVAVIRQDNEWYDERIEAGKERERKRKAAFREQMSRTVRHVTDCPTDKTGQSGTDPLSQIVPNCPRDNTGQDGTDPLSHVVPHPSSLPSSLPPSPPPVPNTNRSRSRNACARAREDEPNGNGNGNGKDFERLRKDAHAFKTDVESDGEGGAGPFFDPRHDPVVIAIALTGDAKSRARWTQLAKGLPEDAVRQELFAFYREMRSGEIPRNRGATLNARLTRLAEKARKGGDA